MSLQRTPAWESAGPVRLPDYQKRSRRWELFRGRNRSARQADQRRLLIRSGAAVFTLAAFAALAVTLPGLLRPAAPASTPMQAAVTPAPRKAAAPAGKRIPPVNRDQIQWKTVVATAYCPHCRVCETTGITYTGRNAIPDGVAVARRGPRAARLGTKLLVPGRGWLHVDDVGGGVDSNQIDIRVSTHAEAVQFGRRQMRVGVKEASQG